MAAARPVPAAAPPHARPRRYAFLACNRNAARYAEDPSYTYRCENLALALRAAGHEVWLGHASRWPWWQPVDAVLFHRPRGGWRFRALLALLQRRGVAVLADVDDLVFDPALAEHSPGVVNGLVSPQATRAMFAANRAALASVPHLSVSTAALAEEARRCFPAARITLVPNAVHRSWHPLADAGPAGLPPPVIGYAPGTRSHDRDFAEVAAPIAWVLRRHPAARLAVTGPLSFELDAPATQVEQHAKRPFAEFHHRVRAARVNIAPLQDSRFTRCKSALKVIEAGAWGIPTVCSPLPDAERFVGAGACIVAGEAAWEQALERLLFDDAHYLEQTRGLRDRVRAQADIDAIARDWLAALDAHGAAA